jgi:hypothetical protein
MANPNYDCRQTQKALAPNTPIADATSPVYPFQTQVRTLDVHFEEVYPTARHLRDLRERHEVLPGRGGGVVADAELLVMVPMTDRATHSGLTVSTAEFHRSVVYGDAAGMFINYKVDLVPELYH